MQDYAWVSPRFAVTIGRLDLDRRCMNNSKPTTRERASSPLVASTARERACWTLDLNSFEVLVVARITIHGSFRGFSAKAMSARRSSDLCSRS